MRFCDPPSHQSLLHVVHHVIHGAPGERHNQRRDSVCPRRGHETTPVSNDRFRTSCDWQKVFSTLVFGSVPILAAPISCVASPMGSMDFLYGKTSASHA